MNNLVLLTVIDIVLLIAGLAIYLFIVGRQLTKVANNLEEAADLVWKIKENAEIIEPGLKRINRTGGIVAGALPLLYTMAEGIVKGATYEPADVDAHPIPARPAMGTRRSRQLEGIGFIGR
jgi:Na+(H+)/acetate symporter ActP